MTDEARASIRVAELMNMGYSIHFHVWRMHDLVDLLTLCIDEMQMQANLELLMRHGLEVICVLRRTAEPSRSTLMP